MASVIEGREHRALALLTSRHAARRAVAQLTLVVLSVVAAFSYGTVSASADTVAWAGTRVAAFDLVQPDAVGPASRVVAGQGRETAAVSSTFVLACCVATESTGPVSELEVGRYGDLAKRSVGDGMTPDHIPSNAARRASVEQDLGRELTPSEARALRDEGNCLVVQTCAHQEVSRTYGGRNNPSQIAADAADLRGAATQDLAVWRQDLIAAGHSPAQVDAAIARLHAANVADGVYP